MGCACGNKNKTTYKVTAPDGKVLYSSPSKPTATAVARRYPGSTVTEVTPSGTASPVITKASAGS
jgi:hypothetical protein